MLRLFGWMLAGGVLLGSASVAKAQVSPSGGDPATTDGGTSSVPVAGNGSSGGNAYDNNSVHGLGNPAIPLLPASGVFYGPGDGGYVVPVIGSHKECFTTYPLSTVYPYSYTGPGRGFGAYARVPYPYVPIGYGWYGEYWRGW